MNVLKKSILIAVIAMATGTCQVSGMESVEEHKENLKFQMESTIKNLQNTFYDTFTNQWAEAEAKAWVTSLLSTKSKTNEEIKGLIEGAKNFILDNEQFVFTGIYGQVEGAIWLLQKFKQILAGQPFLIP
ncbi:hypothetical protein KAT92_02825 [Candidatus Babeliales bacterium]|nr:hypothetical protein [Candidatus Babeliales bacterium]